MWRSLALAQALTLALSCASEDSRDSNAARELGADASVASADPAPDPERCPWSVDDLLDEVGEAPFVGRNCGSVSYLNARSGFTCFEEKRAAGTPVLFTVNKCIDCSIPYTYLATAAGDLFELLMEDDSFGDGQREATVARCAAITLPGFDDDAQVPAIRTNTDAQCTERRELYRCSESRSLPRREPGYPPLGP